MTRLFNILALCIFGICHSQVPQLAWSKFFTSSDSSRVNATASATDLLGNHFVAGNFRDTADFNAAGASATLSAASGNCYLIKHNSAGSQVWARQFLTAPASSLTINAMTTDTAGNLFIAGKFQGTVDIDPGPLTRMLTGSEYVVARFDPMGKLVYHATFGNILSGQLLFINVTAKGQLIVTGFFNGLTDFDPGQGHYMMHGVNHIFMLGLSANNGAFNYAHRFITQEFELNCLESDADGNVLLGGHAWGSHDFDPGAAVVNATASCGFISTFDVNGNFKKVRLYYGSFRVNDIKTLPQHGLAINGSLYGQFDADPGPGILQLNGSGTGFYIWVLKYDSLDGLIWHNAIGNAQPTCYMMQKSLLRTDGQGSIYTGIYFTGTCDFDPGTATHTLSSNKVFFGYDLAIVKFDPLGVFQWAGATAGYSAIHHPLKSTMHVMTNGDVYINGVFRDSVDADPGQQVTMYKSGCDESAYLSKISVCANIEPVVGASAVPANACEGDGVVLAAGGAVTYIWNGGLPSQSTVMVTPSVTTTYEVAGFGSNGCNNSATVTITVSKCTSVSSLIQRSISIFPNPASSHIIITGIAEGELTLFDISGRTVQQQPFAEHGYLNISELRAGVYFCRLESGNSVFTGKLVITR